VYVKIILPFTLCGCETFSVILREEDRLRVFENRVPGKTFRHKTDEVREGMEKTTY